MRNEPDEHNEDDVTLTDELLEDAEPELEAVEAHAATTLKNLRAKLKTCQEEKAAALEEVQRIRADFLNARKHLAEQATRDTTRAVDRLIEELLPVCDSFVQAMNDTSVWESVAPEWRRGMEGIYQQVQNLLARYEVQPLDPIGETFDPNLHEALATETSDQPPETITQVVQLGYLRSGSVLRPAKVIISE